MTLTKIKTGGIQDDAVTSGKIPANAVGSSELADNAVDTAAIADQAVTLAKLEHGTSSNSGKFLRANNGADPTFETIDTNLVSDTSPQLGGNLDCNGNNILIDDGNKLHVGNLTSSTGDLQLHHVSADSFSYIDTFHNLAIRKDNGEKLHARFINNAQVELYYNNSQKFATSNNGVGVTGNVFITDSTNANNGRLVLGATSDLQIYHNGTDSHLDNTTGELALRGATIRLRGNPQNNETLAVFEENGAAKLYYNNGKKLETNSTGTTLFCTGNGNNEGPKIEGSSSMPAILNFQADAGAANGDKCRFYGHQSGGSLILQDFSAGSFQNMAKFNFGGTVELYNNNVKKFETTNAGVTVTGTVTATSFSGDGSNLTGVSSVGGATGVDFNDNVQARFGTDNDLIIYHNNTDGQIANSTGNLILANSTDGQIFIDPKNNERGIVVKPDAEVELYYNNTVQFETRDGGATTPGWFASGINAQLNGAKGTFANDGTHLSCRSFATGGYDSIIFRSANTTVGKVFFNSGGTQYHTSSDYRRKQNIVNLTGAINRVKSLLPKRFNFISEPDVTRDGFLAHEVGAVPEAVQGTKDQVATEKDVEEGKADAVGDPIYQTIDQSALVPLLTAAIKELISRVEVLEAA
jgi:hypothetical protein